MFFVMDGRLRTPALECGLLDGITRVIVIRLAEELNIHVEEGHYTVDQLHRADECFLTNTSMEIMPVTSVDRRPVGDGKPGSLTQKLREQFRAVRSRYGKIFPSDRSISSVSITILQLFQDTGTAFS